MSKKTIRLAEAKVGDVVLDERARTRRQYGSCVKHVWVGTDVVRGVVTEAAAPSNRFTVTVQFPEGLRGRNGQFINVEA